MSMLFINKKEKEVVFSINNRGWRRIFLLGLMFGWEPEGTGVPAGWSVGRTWNDKNYATNEGQVVKADDAMELAEALEQAIPLLKEPEAEDPQKSMSFMWEFELYQRFEKAMDIGLRDPGYIFFDSRWTDKLNELVAFCRRGAFKIR